MGNSTVALLTLKKINNIFLHNNITTETEVPNVLNSSNGTISVGPSGGKETYYNLNMNIRICLLIFAKTSHLGFWYCVEVICQFGEYCCF